MIKPGEKTITIPAVPAKTQTVTSYRCEECDKTFGDKVSADEHDANKHSYDEHKTLDGNLGPQEELPWDLRGDDVYHFQTKEALEAFQGYKGTGRITQRGWTGPGWYALVHGTDNSRRGNEYKYIALVDLKTLEYHLTDHFRSVVARLRAVRAVLGPKCTSCDYHNGTHASYCSAST